MLRFLRVLPCPALVLVCAAAPGGWGVTPAGSVTVDDQVVHGGRWSLRIDRPTDSGGGLSGISKSIPMEFAGKTLEMRGYLRTQAVTGFAAMWMLEDLESTALEFDKMQPGNLTGTTGWQRYSISLPVNARAKQLLLGVFVTGTGTVWVDDLQLLVDGNPVWEAPRVDRSETPLDTDHEFDEGSGIAINSLTPVQIENLATLGKVWGFLKYHHPAITGGRRHWDYDLFRILPAVLAAPDRKTANATLVEWIAGLGAPAACNVCAVLETDDLHLRPSIEWLDDPNLGSGLGKVLREILSNRPASGKQFYVSLTPTAGNPRFQHEPGYERTKAGDAGFQILGAYRFWNIIEYWYPYRDLLGKSWDEVLKESLPKIALAKTPMDYQRSMMALIARVQDTHANLWSSLAAQPPAGACTIAVNVRFIDNLAVVAGAPPASKASDLKPGDVIMALDGVPVSKLVENWRPFYAASNEPTRLRDIARTMTRGVCGEVSLRVRRENQDLTVTAVRVPPGRLGSAGAHDLPGSTFRKFSDGVAYLKLSSIRVADVPRYLYYAAGTKGLIIDIRGYPSEFVVFTLGPFLVDQDTSFARRTIADLSNPGAFRWSPEIATLRPQAPHYSGKVVLLVDEASQSQAEYTAMAFRAVRGAKVVGSTTAGADGNVSAIPLPGGLRSMISGNGVFYPDKTPTQRVGIIPDVEAKPTIAGIREGRDEVLEEAVRQILGGDAHTEQIEKMLRQQR